MNLSKQLPAYLFSSAFIVLGLSGCSTNSDNSSTTATTQVQPPTTQVLTVIPRPNEIASLENGSNSTADSGPVLRILSPADGSTINGSTVTVEISVNGQSSGNGDRVVIVLDNEPHEAYYDPGETFELRNVATGRHLLRAMLLKPWRESYKNSGASQITSFSALGNSDRSKPTVTTRGQVIADSTGETAKSMVGLTFDPSRPLLTFDLPGDLEVRQGGSMMIDFLVANAKLRSDGGDYRVRYIIDDDEPRYIDKLGPIWLSGWLKGRHTIRLELIGPDGWPFRNGDANIVTREISVERN